MGTIFWLIWLSVVCLLLFRMFTLRLAGRERTDILFGFGLYRCFQIITDMICLLRIFSVCQNRCLFDMFSTCFIRVFRFHCHALTGDCLFLQIIQGDEYYRIRILKLCFSGHDIDGCNTIDFSFVFHLRIHLRQSFNCFLIQIIFKLQTALQFSTHTGKLFGIQCQKLIFCHVDGDDIKVRFESAAAALHTTCADTTKHLCLISFTDLTQFNTAMQTRSKTLEQLTEVDSLICDIYKQHLGTIQCIGSREKSHIQTKISDIVIADRKCFFLCDQIVLIVFSVTA